MTSNLYFLIGGSLFMFWNSLKKIKKQGLEEEVKQILKLYTQLCQEYMLW